MYLCSVEVLLITDSNGISRILEKKGTGWEQKAEMRIAQHFFTALLDPST